MVQSFRIIHIYAQDLAWLTLIVVAVLAGWTVLLLIAGKWKAVKITLKILCVPMAAVVFYGIMLYTVLGREASELHILIFMAPYSKEFVRELFMNALLYFPLGLSLSVLIGPRVMWAAFILSAGIEAWQYFAGTGQAQGTDVIMNIFGYAIGALPWIIARAIRKRGGPSASRSKGNFHDKSDVFVCHKASGNQDFSSCILNKEKIRA